MNFQEQSFVPTAYLNQLQIKFEREMSNPDLKLEESELDDCLDFKHKTKDGNYACVITLALFNIFSAGYFSNQKEDSKPLEELLAEDQELSLKLTSEKLKGVKTLDELMAESVNPEGSK